MDKTLYCARQNLPFQNVGGAELPKGIGQVRSLDYFFLIFLLRDAAVLTGNAGLKTFRTNCLARFAILRPAVNLSTHC
jgi:hypothetical protein